MREVIKQDLLSGLAGGSLAGACQDPPNAPNLRGPIPQRPRWRVPATLVAEIEIVELGLLTATEVADTAKRV